MLLKSVCAVGCTRVFPWKYMMADADRLPLMGDWPWWLLRTVMCTAMSPCRLWGSGSNLALTLLYVLCHAVPSSPPSTTMRCGSNDWMAPSLSCTSPSCRKANTLSSTRKNTRSRSLSHTHTRAYIQAKTIISAVSFLSPFCVVSFYILAICTVPHLTSLPLVYKEQKKLNQLTLQV